MGLRIEDADRADRLPVGDDRHPRIKAQVRLVRDAGQLGKIAVRTGIGQDQRLAAAQRDHARTEGVLRRRPDFRRALARQEPLVRAAENGDEGNRCGKERGGKGGDIVEIGVRPKEHRHGGVERRKTLRRPQNRGNIGRQ